MINERDGTRPFFLFGKLQLRSYIFVEGGFFSRINSITSYFARRNEKEKDRNKVQRKGVVRVGGGRGRGIQW